MFHKKIILLALLSGLSIQLLAGNAPGNTVKYSVDLTKVEHDRLTIEMLPGAQKKNQVVFCMPKIVPGIYGDMNFGRNITAFSATDAQGKPLPTQNTGVNTWTISKAKKLAKISYQVNDGWEEFDMNGQMGFYRSAESSFKKDEVFVINHNSLFGYLEGQNKAPVEVTVRKPAQLYGATTLDRSVESPDKDVFTAKDYRTLTDNPVMYCVPDTANLQLGNAKIQVAMYSSTGQRLAQEVAAFLKPLLLAQMSYLGGKLPVSKYVFLIYHAPSEQEGFAGDGLEHATSTLCLMATKLDREMVNQYMYRIASHEFFHIVTPLNIHSKEIQDYDFLNPTFSRHLWLYEGMTEYATMHMPVKEGLISIEDFLKEVNRKAQGMRGFGDHISLTQLSLEVVKRQDEFYNQYLKGALMCMCLDIRLRELSGGKYGTRQMMEALSQKFGPDTPFNDEELFDIIAGVTYPEIRAFFKEYAETARALPVNEFLDKVGIQYVDDKVGYQVSPNATPEQVKLRVAWLGR